MGERQGYESETHTRAHTHTQSPTYIYFPDDSQASLGGIAYPTGQDHVHSRRILNHRGSQAPLTETERKKGWVHVMWVRPRGAPGLSLNC